MFFVFNKRKIKSYLISLGTVAILFSVSFFSLKSENVVQTQASFENIIAAGPILKAENKTKEIALSINCSENAENIDKMLQILIKANVKATFFVTGKVATENTELIKKIVDTGNELGSLTNTYVHLKEKSASEVKKQISEAVKNIEKITNKKIVTFRAPYGEYNKVVLNEIHDQNLKLIGWNIDSLDYNGLNAEEMWERINENLEPGSIILFHNSAKYTCDGLEEIINKIKEKNYTLTTVQEMVG